MHLENNKLIVTMLKLEKPPNETEEVFKNWIFHYENIYQVYFQKYFILKRKYNPLNGNLNPENWFLCFLKHNLINLLS